MGVMATDALSWTVAGVSPSCSDETIRSSTRCCRRSGRAPTRSTSSATRPAQRYADALKILMRGAEQDAILVLNAPTAVASSVEAAKAVVDTRRGRPTSRPS